MESQIEDLVIAYYSPSNSYELMNPETGEFYNHLGQELRSPDEYNQNYDGYTPFGDE